MNDRRCSSRHLPQPIIPQICRPSSRLDFSSRLSFAPFCSFPTQDPENLRRLPSKRKLVALPLDCSSFRQVHFPNPNPNPRQAQNHTDSKFSLAPQCLIGLIFFGERGSDNSLGMTPKVSRCGEKNKARALGNSSGQWPKPLGHNWNGASPGALTEMECQCRLSGHANRCSAGCTSGRVALMRVGCDVESLGLPVKSHACVCDLRS